MHPAASAPTCAEGGRARRCSAAPRDAVTVQRRAPSLAQPARAPSGGPLPAASCTCTPKRPRAALALPNALPLALRRLCIWGCRGARTRQLLTVRCHSRQDQRPGPPIQSAGGDVQVSWKRCGLSAALPACLMPCACVAAQCPRACGRRRCGSRLRAAARRSDRGSARSCCARLAAEVVYT